MPLSADHTVHLTRVYLYGEQLAGGHLVGWSPTWFFGFPLGELYPVLGDLGVLALRVLSLGLLDWPQAYALLFTLVFLTQGLALLRCGRALGWGPVPGLCAALLALADVGAYREGGWTYTVLYGVWPQTLATALAWLTFAELALAARAASPVLSDSTTPPVLSGSASSPVPPDSLDPPPPVPRDSDHSVRRHLALATLAAAGALLAHPMALMMLALGAPLYFITVGLRGGPRRSQLAETALHLALALTLGAALAAWWLLPMSAHRGWMANYGWLHAPLADMLRMASLGQWTQFMPTAVGHCASLGLLAAALLGRAPLRFFALWTVAHWLLASTDIFWGLRLDWLSGGFQHIQYQRFLIAAKPGFFLLAGAALGGLCHLAVRTWSNRHVRSAIRRPLTGLSAGRSTRFSAGLSAGLSTRLSAALSAGLAAALALWQLVDTRAQMQRGRGRPDPDSIACQRERSGAFEADYRRLPGLGPQDQWQTRDHDYRIAVREARNLHWFMDAPLWLDTPIYKQGFTPGDNFVHKPEQGRGEVLDALGVRCLVSTSNMGAYGATRPAQVARFTCSPGGPRASRPPASRAAASSRSSSPPSPATVCASASAA